MLVREHSPSTNMARVPTASPDKPTFLYSSSIRNDRQGVLQLNLYLLIYLFLFLLFAALDLRFTSHLAMKGYMIHLE